MLKGVDHRLYAEILHALRAMGHGDMLMLRDVNFPGTALAPHHQRPPSDHREPDRSQRPPVPDAYDRPLCLLRQGQTGLYHRSDRQAAALRLVHPTQRRDRPQGTPPMTMQKPTINLGIFAADAAFRAQHLPRMGETIMGSSFHLGPGGTGSNQAVASAMARGCSHLITRLGDDDFAAMVRGVWARTGITPEVTVDKGNHPGAAMIFPEAAAGNKAILVIHRAGGAFNGGLAVVLAEGIPIARIALRHRHRQSFRYSPRHHRGHAKTGRDRGDAQARRFSPPQSPHATPPPSAQQAPHRPWLPHSAAAKARCSRPSG